MRAKGVCDVCRWRMPAGCSSGIISADYQLDLLADEPGALARLQSREQARECQIRT